VYNFLRWHTKEVFFQGRATRRLARVFSVAAMPAAVARKTGKRSVSKAKKVKNVGLKRTKGVCAPYHIGNSCPLACLELQGTFG
jgi:hypothetical protein